MLHRMRHPPYGALQLIKTKQPTDLDICQVDSSVHRSLGPVRKGVQRSGDPAAVSLKSSGDSYPDGQTGVTANKL